jgi:hypothetical protein
MKNCGIGDVSNVKFTINEGLDSPTSEAEEGGRRWRGQVSGGRLGEMESNCSEQKDIEFFKNKKNKKIKRNGS